MSIPQRVSAQDGRLFQDRTLERRCHNAAASYLPQLSDNIFSSRVPSASALSLRQNDRPCRYRSQNRRAAILYPENSPVKSNSPRYTNRVVARSPRTSISPQPMSNNERVVRRTQATHSHLRARPGTGESLKTSRNRCAGLDVPAKAAVLRAAMVQWLSDFSGFVTRERGQSPVAH